jgi:hypothetical protein
MKMQDFKALRRTPPAARTGPAARPSHADKHLHRNWVLIPALIFAVLAAVAVFGDGRPERPDPPVRRPAFLSLKQVLAGRS